MGHYFEMSKGHHGWYQRVRDFYRPPKFGNRAFMALVCMVSVIIMFLGPYQTNKTKRALSGRIVGFMKLYKESICYSIKWLKSTNLQEKLVIQNCNDIRLHQDLAHLARAFAHAADMPVVLHGR